jgi:methionyl-tRNA formyltransferase
MAQGFGLVFFASRTGALDAVRRAGRDRILGVQTYAPSDSLRAWCERWHIPWWDAAVMSRSEARARVAALAPEVIVANGYPRLIGPRCRALASLAAINIHPGLLPYHRGPAPINAALLAGDRVAGVTAHLMDDGFDTGAIIARRRIPVRPDETAATLYPRLFALEGPTCLAALARLRFGRGRFPAQPPVDRPVFRRTVETMRIDWSRPAEAVCRLVRAFAVDTQGAYTGEPGRAWQIWSALPVSAGYLHEREQAALPGTILRVAPDGALLVRTGDGAALVRDHTPPASVTPAPGRRIDAIAATSFATADTEAYA